MSIVIPCSEKWIPHIGIIVPVMDIMLLNHGDM